MNEQDWLYIYLNSKFMRAKRSSWLKSVGFLASFLICLPFLLLSACASFTPSPTSIQEVSPVPTNTSVVFPPTWTVGPTETSGPMPTLLPTGTPLATETPIPTLGPSPTTFPPIRSASEDDLPSLSYGLLFLEGGRLKLLTGDTGQVRELVEKEFVQIEEAQETSTTTPTIEATETTVPQVEPSTTATELTEATATRTPFPTVTPLVGFGGTASPTPQNGLSLTPTPVEGNALEDILQFSIQAQGNFLALDRSIGTSRHEIVLYNRSTGEIEWSLSLEVEEVIEVSIAPDGSWVVFVVSVMSDEEDEAEDVVYVLNAIPMDRPEIMEVGICDGKCSNLIWSSDSRTLVWGDESGLRSSSPPFNSNILILLEPFLVQATASQNITDSYVPISWSPSERYLLLQVGLGKSDKRAVFALNEGIVNTLPGPFVTADPNFGIAWLTEDRLLISRPAGFTDSGLSSAEIWQIDPSAEEMLLLLDSFPLGSTPDEAIYIPYQLPNGRVGYALLDIRSAVFKSSFGLYSFDLGGGESVKLNDLPAIRIREGIWVPDGSGVLITTLRNTLFVPTNGGAIYDVRGILGLNACCYEWVK